MCGVNTLLSASMMAAASGITLPIANISVAKIGLYQLPQNLRLQSEVSSFSSYLRSGPLPFEVPNQMPTPRLWTDAGRSFEDALDDLESGELREVLGGLTQHLASDEADIRKAAQEHISENILALDAEDERELAFQSAAFLDHENPKVRGGALTLIDNIIVGLDEEVARQILLKSAALLEDSDPLNRRMIIELFDLSILDLKIEDRGIVALKIADRLDDEVSAVRPAAIHFFVDHIFRFAAKELGSLSSKLLRNITRQQWMRLVMWHVINRLSERSAREVLHKELTRQLSVEGVSQPVRAEIQNMIRASELPDISGASREELLAELRPYVIRFDDGGEGISPLPLLMDHLIDRPAHQCRISLSDIPFHRPCGTISLTDFLRQEGVQGTGRSLGRSMVYAISRGDRVLVVKYTKKGQNGSDLVRELQWQQSLRSAPEEMRSQYPRPSLGEDGRLRQLRFEGDDREAISFTAPSAYYTYLDDPTLTDTVFMKGLSDGIHDIFTLARYGIFHTAPITAFHNLQARHPYLIAPDIVVRDNPVPGMGHLADWPAALRHGNIGVTGLRDLEELATLDEIMKGDRWMPELHTLRGRPHAESLYEAMLLGNAYLAATLYIGNRIAQAVKKYDAPIPHWKNDKWLENYADQLLHIYAIGYAARRDLSYEESIKKLRERAGWLPLARQLTFFMTPAHIPYVRPGMAVSHFPQEIYGTGVVVLGGRDSVGQLMGPYRHDTFDLKKGFIGEGGLALGPFNGQNPIKEFERAWMATLF